MARSEFDKDTERGDAFRQIGQRNKVGRKHNHQPRGRAKERARKKMGPVLAKKRKRLDAFHARVCAYWRGEVENYPAEPQF